jgi:hypothetical protein
MQRIKTGLQIPQPINPTGNIPFYTSVKVSRPSYSGGFRRGSGRPSGYQGERKEYKDLDDPKTQVAAPVKSSRMMIDYADL